MSTERSRAEPAAFAALRTRVAAALRARGAEIAERWEERSQVVALRDAPAGEAPQGVSSATLVEAIVATLSAAGPGGEDSGADDLVTCGLAHGADAFIRDASLHHTLKGVDLVTAMVLYAVELAVTDEPGASAADGVRLSRRIQQAASLLTLAVAKGYTQAMDEAMRDRLRHLRHDLRNPLGTIKSVLAMMDDETMPADARAHPRFRAMAKRNALSLGELIADRLRDGEAIAPALVHQRASLRTIAAGVRRDLRAEAVAREATIAVGEAPARMLVDAIGLELILHELLLAALQEAAAGDELRLEFGEAKGEATVTLTCHPSRPPVAAEDVLRRVVALAAQMRGRLESFAAVRDPALVLWIPAQRVDVAVQAAERGTTVPVSAAADLPPAPRATSGGREARHDVRRPGEREHREPGAL